MATKIPPGGAPPPRPQKPDAQKTDAPKTDPKVQTQKDTKAVEAQKTEPKTDPKSDAFVQKGPEHGAFKSTDQKLDAKLHDAFSQAHSMSGIENLVRLLESARAQLLAEHGRLHAEAQKCLERLVKGGFSDAQLAQARAELMELRKKMNALRKRLQHMRKRLRSTFGHAGKTADANLGKTMTAQLERLQALEPGMSRSLGALNVIEQAYGNFSDGSTPVLVGRSEGEPTPELVHALAALAPGAVVSRALTGLVTGRDKKKDS